MVTFPMTISGSANNSNGASQMTQNTTDNVWSRKGNKPNSAEADTITAYLPKVTNFEPSFIKLMLRKTNTWVA